MTDPARTIDITPAEKSEAQSIALILPGDARAIKVLDYGTREAANAFFLKCREARKRIAAVFDPHIDRAKEAKKKADEVRAGLVAEKDAAESPIREAEAIVNREILRFDTEDKKRRDEELRIATEKQRKENEEAALRAAAEAEKAGDHEEADAILQEAEKTPTFVPAPPPPPKLTGSTEVVTWNYQVLDPKLLLVAASQGKVAFSIKDAAGTTGAVHVSIEVGKLLTAQKEFFSLPGIKIWSEKSRRGTGR